MDFGIFFTLGALIGSVFQGPAEDSLLPTPKGTPKGGPGSGVTVVQD